MTRQDILAGKDGPIRRAGKGESMLINCDFDGVIADTFGHLLALCRAAQAEVGAGRPPVADDLRTLENLTFAGLAQRLEIPDTSVPLFVESAFALQQRTACQVNFFDGMRELLLAMREVANIAIITSSCADVVRDHLKDHGLGSTVATVTGGESGQTKEEAIRANMAHFSSLPQQTFMVGDAVSDIRQGRLAGVRTIAVSWGFHARPMLVKESPDYLADSPTELLGILLKNL